MEITGKDTLVSMPVKLYRFIRIKDMAANTIRYQADSIRNNALKIFKTKDSIISVQDQKLAIKDTMIAEKNKTIKLLADLPKEPSPSKLVIPLVIVSVAEFFLLILAMK